MKLTILLLTVALLNVSASSLSQTVHFSGAGVPLKKVFSSVEKQTGFVFFFDGDMLKDSRPVTITTTGMELNDFLQRILENQPLEYAVRNKTIFISRKSAFVPLPPAFPVSVIEITGTIVNAEGDAITGASVINLNSKRTVVSDNAGKFTIPASMADVLVISSVGYLPAEVKVKNDNAPLTILLEREIKKLNEVVVVGYGTQTKRNVTGSITKIDMKKTETLPNTNVMQAIRGRVAGVQFLDGSRPGQNGSILVRGPKSLSAGNQPLIVLDGIFFNGSLADIAPGDINSMEILKDASAAAIYGSRGANGVILITSKRGKSEMPEIRLNVYSGYSDWSYVPKLLSPERYVQRILDYRTQAGLPSDPALVKNYLGTLEGENYQAGLPVDPWKEASQNARTHSYDVSLSGKVKTVDYFISGSMTKEKGLIYNDNWKRSSVRASVENQVKEWLKVGFTASYSSRDISGASNTADLQYVVVASPYGTWYHEDGEPTQFPVAEENAASNPIRRSKLLKNEYVLNNLFANFYAVVQVPFVKGLSYRLNYAPNYRWNYENNFFRQDKHLTQNTTYANKWNQRITDNVIENIVTYTKQINTVHSFDLTLLYGTNKQYSEEARASAELLSSDVVGWNNLRLGSIFTSTSDASQVKGTSSMARLNYRLMDKYFLTLTARRDGSSVFAQNNKYAMFPSGALAWVVSDEPFFAHQSFIDILKLRLSYGAVGNQAIDPYESLSLTSATQYTFADRLTATGLYTSSMANADLKWESTYTANIGLDFELLKGRISGSIELYNMDTRNLLASRSIPTVTGFSSVLTNIGAVNNRGVELTLNTVNFRSKRFEWTTDIVFSHNKNKIVHLYRTDADKNGIEDDDIGNSWFIGKPMNVAYNYEWDGIYQEGDILPAGYKPGFVRLKDQNGDKQISADDRIVLGQTAEPKFRYGITNNLKYGDFSLSVFVNVAQGWIGNFTAIAPNSSAAGRSLNKIDAGWWTPENKSGSMPSLVYNNPLGHGYYLKRDFVRLQDISVSYTFPKKILDVIKFKQARVYVSGKNIFTITDWLGPDPESGKTGTGDLYPRSRTFVAGMTITL